MPLLLILLGAALVAFSMGPYQSYDAQLEFEAASNLLKTGIPYVKAYGTAIDQPPLGFYLEAAFLAAFGVSVDVGVVLITLFGLASVVVVYLLGRELYGKSTGLLAAAFFGLNPWQLVLSRSFLIDAQCLFFSLLCLLVGIFAIKRGSVKLTLVAGVVFAAAILTKMYAAFVLVPLLLFYLYSRPKNLKRILSQLAAFALPAVIGAVIWYQGIRGVSVLTILQHNDLADAIPASTGVIPSPFFVGNFLLNYGLGIFLISAVAFALALVLLLWRRFSRFVAVGLIGLASVAFIVCVNTALGAGLSLNVPYFSAVKYDYQALPFFMLLAASLVALSVSLLRAARHTIPSHRLVVYLAASTGIVLLFASLVWSMLTANLFSQFNYLQFRVEPQVDYGYAFLNPTPLTAGSLLFTLQFVGFAVVLWGLLLSALLWVGGQRLRRLPVQLKTLALQNKARTVFLGFAVAYGIILLLNLTNQPMNWDEIPHLNGALYLNSGLYDKFVSNAFYPPLFDVAASAFFNLFGISLFAARLVPALFSVLTLWAVFELAYSMYGGKVALLSAGLLAVMPGYFWLSRMSLLETMLDFFFAVALLFFFRWLQNREDTDLVLCGLAVGLGFLTKYQMVAALLVMVVSLLFLARGQLKRAFSRFPIVLVVAVLVVVPWFIAAYQVYASGVFGQWLYALQVGNPERSVYSLRYPAPIFYLIEMVWPYSTIHPISVFLYILGLAGLGYLAWRHSRGDKYVLIWFISVLVFFTLIANKEWRYVLPLFPALAISAAVLAMFIYGKLDGAWRRQVKINRKRALKVAAGAFVVLMAGAVAYSVNDAYFTVAYYNIDIQLEPATRYAMANMNSNESIMVLCPFNFFSADMVKFYLWQNGNPSIQTYQYPAMPVDTYTPIFNITELTSLCRQNNVKYVFTYEYGGTVPYYNTTLNLQQVYEQLYASGNFSQISDKATFGANPRRIFILTFLG